ncbi:AAA family ATPase [Halococcus agarilyticus]|uniref:AAA family ATPase n=1 Tax=Halococcus agarilyticus TaxID=1232219 RepID=UPI0006779241|nr:AAA family ATPase [Halococcus agarilyticus]
MSGADDDGVELTVTGARKRDAGRGVARLPEPARRALGVLSGDTVVIVGERATVAKVWPAGGDLAGDAVRVDADTRTNAGVNVGDTVRVQPVSVADADRITVDVPGSVDAGTADDLAALVKRALLDRPIKAGEHFRIERLGPTAFSIAATQPEGTVRVTNETQVTTHTESTASSEPARTGTTGDAGTAPATEATGGDGAPRVAYEDIGGLDDELDQVREMIELPLSEPELFQELGIDPPSGVLLYGPPGTGKTLIARAVAGEVDAHFSTISGPEIVSKYKGESEEKLREAFDAAAVNEPAVVFIDEIDSIGGARGDDADMETRVVAQLLTLMDGLEDRGRVVVIGATNRVDAIDPALRRGGRFDREIEIGVPGEAGRREILDVHTRSMPLAEDVSLDRLAGRTHGFVGADLESLAVEAAMAALRKRDDRDELDVTRADFERAMAAVDPSAMREYVAETPDVGFDDVGGLDAAKSTLTEAVEWPLSYGALFEAAATDPPAGVLLYGPPGTGKTMLARALAGESDVNFISVAGPEILDRYVGESEKAVREVFDRARQAAPAIVFFDEIDAIAGGRGEKHEVTERVVSQLLTEIDGLAENPNLMVLAATNRRDAIDPALLRPGRIESHVEVPAPDEAARRAILDVHTREKPVADDVDLDALAPDLVGFSGADIEALCRAASMRAIREVAGAYDPEEAETHADEISITEEHFAAARESVEPTFE